MTSIRPTPPAAAAVAIAAAMALGFLSGCGGPPPAEKGPRALLATPVGPALGKLWDAHGGLAAWEKIGEVRFDYEAVVDREGVPAKVGPVRVGFVPGGWASIDVEDAAGRRTVPIDGEPRDDPTDFALRQARLFFALPFALADPVWEFQRWAVQGEERPDPWRISAGPGSGISRLPVDRLIVHVERETGIPRSIRSFSRGGPAAGLEARVIRSETVGGIRVAAEVVHVLAGAVEARYPWEAPPAAGATGDLPQAPVILRQKFSKVDLVPREAAPSPAAPPPAGEVPR